MSETEIKTRVSVGYEESDGITEVRIVNQGPISSSIFAWVFFTVTDDGYKIKEVVVNGENDANYYIRKAADALIREKNIETVYGRSGSVVASLEHGEEYKV